MNFILNILLFLVSLGILVTIHEFGHFTMAKIFNVYCEEFSIGFGPLLFKKKKGETQYSIRAIPLGGYVAMAGEGVEIENQPNLPKERSLEGIARWKRAIIMVAGVTLNFVVGFFLFIGYFATTLQLDTRYNRLAVEEGSVLAQAGLTYEDRITGIDFEAVISGAAKKDSITGIEDGNDLYNAINHLYTDDKINKTEFYPITKDDICHLTFTIAEKTDKVSVSLKVVEDGGELSWNTRDVGIVFFGRNLNFGEVITHSFSAVGENSVLIFKALGQLFTPSGFNNLGGPIAVFQASMRASNLGIGYFLQLWGMISVNLAVVNLLPFPGLDGWHLFVVTFEGITRKSIPQKAKNIASTIGMVLLFGIMILVTLKDIIGLF